MCVYNPIIIPECTLTSKDLILNYDCMTKQDLTKEIKRFERMQIDLKSNLDRLQWRLDCESKVKIDDAIRKLLICLH
jgi:hypothetical protein